QRLLVLAHGHYAVLDWQILASDDFEDPSQGARGARVDVQDARVRPRCSQQSAEGHARELQIVRVTRAASGLGQAVGLGERCADDVDLVDHAATAPRIRCAASSTASKILT